MPGEGDGSGAGGKNGTKTLIGTPPRQSQSLPQREIVVQRTVKDVGDANWLVLTRTNYGEWAVLMNAIGFGT
jgi:hypothetical protein